MTWDWYANSKDKDRRKRRLERESIPRRKINCAWCGEEIETTDRRKRFCDSECNSAFQNRKIQEKKAMQCLATS